MSTIANTASGCAVKPAIAVAPRRIAVNGVAISRADIAREAQHHPANSPAEAMEAAARALVVRELLLQEGRVLGLVAVPAVDAEGRRETDDEALIRSVIETQVDATGPSDEECLRYYDQNRPRFRSAPLYEVSHILVAAAPDDKDGRGVALAAARALCSDLIKRPDSFEELARANSACPSAQNSGNLGQIGPGQTVPEFERALSEMAPGHVHPDPVESRYGFHVVRVNRKLDGRQIPYELAKPRISAWLADRARQTALRRYLTQIACRADIDGIALHGIDGGNVRGGVRQ